MGGEKGGGRATFGGEGPLRVRITERPNKEHGKMSVQKEMSWGYSGGILLQVSHCVQAPCAFFTRLQRKVLLSAVWSGALLSQKRVSPSTHITSQPCNMPSGLCTVGGRSYPGLHSFTPQFTAPGDRQHRASPDPPGAPGVRITHRVIYIYICVYCIMGARAFRYNSLSSGGRRGARTYTGSAPLRLRARARITIRMSAAA